MNRREEYWVLTEQLRREPPELESAVRRGMDRARRRRRRPAELLAGLAGVCAAFVVMVNASPAFAISCAKVPVLRELAAAVAFSPSLRAAAQLVLAHIDEDPGQPGLEELGLPQLPAVPEGAVHRLVHRVHGAGLAAQIEPGGAVEPAFQALRLLNEFLFGQGWRPLSAY